MTERIGRRGQLVPPSSATVRYPGRTCHWIRPNDQERIPHRWIVTDTESDRVKVADGEQLAFRLGAAVRWRDDLATGDHREHLRYTDPLTFWQWVTDHCWTHGRTIMWCHNLGHDLAQLDAFTLLPQLGYEMAWCNLSRDVSVVTWRGPRGTLVMTDTFTWCPVALEELAPLVGMAKTRLPHTSDPEEVWWERVEADVEITRRVVEQLLAIVRSEHLGNWQPSGAGMGHTAWRHRFMADKVLVHDDADALEAEREAMHAGRAEAWWHGRARGGPFTEWDMHMSYCRIAAECLLPAKLWDHDVRPSAKVHSWALDHWRVLARVTVTTDVPVVPARVGDRTCWPTGTFDTTLWDTELALIPASGGSYVVHEQWRYTRKPALQAWAQWSMAMCGRSGDTLHPVARLWIKHQSRAVIGRLALRTPSWEEWGENWLGHTGISLITDADTGTTHRMMHVGAKVLEETDRAEASHSVPQITSWIMAEARARLWGAVRAAGAEHVLHVDTDSLIVDKDGSVALESAQGQIPGGWRPKETWRSGLVVTGPRHYRAPGRRQVPGVPRRAVETRPGHYEGEVWDSLARVLTEAPGTGQRVRARAWDPQRVDHRRPWTEDGPHRAVPIRLPQGGDGNGGDARPDERGVRPEDLRGDRGQRPGVARDVSLRVADRGSRRGHAVAADDPVRPAPGRAAPGRGPGAGRPAGRRAASRGGAAG